MLEGFLKNMKNFDIISDIHGCFYELKLLLEKLGYAEENGSYKCKDRMLVSVGDIVDRGPSSTLVFQFIKKMVEEKLMIMVRGNHDDKLMRWAKGRGVILNHGLDKTTKDIILNNIPEEEIVEFIESLPYYLSLDGGKLAVVHASWKESLLDKDPFSKKCRSRCLFGPTTGKKLPSGYPDRIDWVLDRGTEGEVPIVVYGHQVYKDVRIENKTYGIDTGCVFGGKLTALRYPEMEIVQVKSEIYDQSKPEIW